MKTYPISFVSASILVADSSVNVVVVVVVIHTSDRAVVIKLNRDRINAYLCRLSIASKMNVPIRTKLCSAFAGWMIGWVWLINVQLGRKLEILLSAAASSSLSNRNASPTYILYMLS